MSDVTVFTIKYDKIVNRLTFPCVIAHNGIVLKATALIDTGATSSYISTNLSTSLKLLKTGQKTNVSTDEPRGIYPFVIAEYLGVHKKAIFHGCTFIEMPFVNNDFNIILGMDFLCNGDLMITHSGDHTIVTICRPSCSSIEYADNIVDKKDIAELIKMMRTLPIDTIHIDTASTAGYNKNTIVLK